MDKILIVEPGPVYQKISPPYLERIQLLGKKFCGDIIMGTNTGDCAFPQVGTFNFHCVKLIKSKPFFKNIHICISVLLRSYILCNIKKNKYKAVISPNPLMSGIVTILIGKIFRIKTIIEVNGDFKEAFKYGSRGEIQLRKIDKIKEVIALRMISFSITHCDIVKTLYSDQLLPLNILSDKVKAVSSFPDYVSVSKFINSHKTDEKYILLIGFPWYLKGVDILIEAFNMISDEFPDYSLKIHGWNPVDNKYFENLAKGNKKIHLGKALLYTEVIDAMAACTIYVLASRTEAMGRVLIEAMASCKPIIASDVGGVSSIITDGYNGLLFEKGKAIILAQKLRLLLKNPKLRNNIALNGYNYIHEKMSEECYLRSFQNMISKI